MGVKVNFESNLPQIQNESKTKVRQILEAIGLKAVSIWTKEISEKKLIDTGRFRSSTTHEVNDGDKSVTVGSNVNYAQYLELGTSRMKARPTLKPAIMNNFSAFKKIAEQIWKQ